ncbi:TonB-dependent receptor [Sphingomonas rubra]|nr:TonB-dependent receptor [Sphingomonas rubra]
MTVFRRKASATRTLTIGTSLGTLAATLMLATPASAQSQDGAAQTSAGVKVPDPAGSSSTAANPNEGVGAADRRSDNAAVTGDVTAAQNETNAQAAGAAAEAATGDPAEGDIVVTGFRRSLENAVVEKKTRDQIVESISAEDIGKLPDASIAESIARLPGLTSQRVSGRSQTISIRGFAPDFSTTLLNGREQTSTSDNRQVEFDQYPSEVVNQVLVYKTPQASIVGQGLAGTVDLRTIRPIEFGRRVISIGGRGTYTDVDKFNPDSKRWGYRVNGTYVDQFLDDRLGVSLAASYIDEPYQFREYRSGGYSTNGPNGAFLVGFPTARGTSTRLKRFGGAGTVEFRPVPEFTSTIDAFYSDFKDLQSRRGVELPLGFGVGDFFGTTFNPATATVTDGVVTAGSFGGVQALVRNDAQRNTAKLYSFGWNNAYKGDDGWNALLDLSYSRTNRSEFSFESYAGTGRGRTRGVNETISFTTNNTGSIFTPQLDYTNPNLFVLTDPAGYGGDIVQAGYFNDRRLTDEIYQVRTEVEKVIEDFFLSGVRVGMNYTRREKTLTPNEAFVTLPNGAQETPIPSQFLLGTFDIGYAFNGIGRALAYNPFDLLNAGVLTLLPRTNANDVLAKAFSVKEDVMTSYVQGNIRQPIGSAELTGNFGVQFVATEQKSTGLIFGPTGTFSQTQGTDYLDVLPSANLSLRLANDFVFRAGVAREIARPRLDDLRIALSYGVDTSSTPPIIRGSAGNANLRPYRATAVDATIEKYFGNSGYIAVQGYYKDLTSFIYRDQERVFDYGGLPAPINAGLLTTSIGTIRQPVNVGGGKLYGVELAGTLPIGRLVGALDGFGLTGGGSYTKTEIRQSPTAPVTDLPGYSRWVANGTAYFEKYGINLRGSVRYRSTFLGELVGFGANRDFRRARDELIVDGQIGYDFNAGFLKGLSVYVQGQNLTDEPFATEENRNELQVSEYQKYGRRYLAGATFKF